MRSICLTLTLAYITSLGSSAARAQDDADRRTISVTGTATVTAANDTAGFSTGVDMRRSSPGAVIDAAVAAGATRVSGPSFWRASTRDLYRRALVDALGKARDKAEALAAESGTTLGEVLRIAESGADVRQYEDSDSASALAAPRTPIEPGRTRVTADLTAVFAMS